MVPEIKRIGIIIATMGFGGMVFGLANKSLISMEKIPIFIFCLGMVVAGILIETPILGRLKGGEECGEFSSPKK